MQNEVNWTEKKDLLILRNHCWTRRNFLSQPGGQIISMNLLIYSLQRRTHTICSQRGGKIFPARITFRCCASVANHRNLLSGTKRWILLALSKSLFFLHFILFIFIFCRTLSIFFRRTHGTGLFLDRTNSLILRTWQSFLIYFAKICTFI